MGDIGIPNILPTLVDRWFTDEFICMYPEVVDARLHEVITTDSDAFLTAFGINTETEMGPGLHDIIVPSLMLTG